MRKLLLFSTGVLWNTSSQDFFPGILEALREIRKMGNAVFLTSNHSKPPWFDRCRDLVQFQRCHRRQDGKIIEELIELNGKANLKHSEIVVFGCSDEDFFMAVNSKTLLIRCEWAPMGEKIRNYGAPWTHPQTVPRVVEFLEDNEPWYFESADDATRIYALTDAGTKFEANNAIRRLAERLRECLKYGAPELRNGLTLHFLSSIYATEVFSTVDLWSYYPSSSSKNDRSEIMSHFADMARTMFKKRVKEPLLIRHTCSPRRHSVGGDRDDPASQVQSVHLNPSFRGKISGKSVAVLDDYINRGVSFAVSSALLLKAGAANVTCVAMGKFGNSAKRFELLIGDDPFRPVTKYRLNSMTSLTGKTHPDAKLRVLRKFRPTS